MINKGFDSTKTICLPYTFISNNVQSYKDGKWIPSVIYMNKDNVMFVRTPEDFTKKFKIKQNE